MSTLPVGYNTYLWPSWHNQWRGNNFTFSSINQIRLRYLSASRCIISFFSESRYATYPPRMFAIFKRKNLLHKEVFNLRICYTLVKIATTEHKRRMHFIRKLPSLNCLLKVWHVDIFNDECSSYCDLIGCIQLQRTSASTWYGKACQWLAKACEQRSLWLLAVHSFICSFKIGRAHVWTPVTSAHLVCRLLLEKKKTQTK